MSVLAVFLYPCVSRPSSLHIPVLNTFRVPPNLMRSVYEMGAPMSGCSMLNACRSVCSSVAIRWLIVIFEMADCVCTRVGYLLFTINLYSDK